ncbi:malto-oligosyltrehalose synthase [Sphingomonas sp. NBWT7]|uniref:malto-oligosyltrehalose synthase n=1 Tax=Sphingomonas sp. NBWT7 TaxID=2596913 RepID=UPI001625B380|nr:malto-oligosyltrehalose synthase [Sphingomonas sp. NBWT7]QNE31581.1 malto-oligosyltrehalose synthase [Sphingomonas sp. NBWT7]
MIPRATYRLQFHAGFTFADAEAIVPYLDRLGISHIYASPVTTAAPGSTHGYDVVDPTTINPELGGEDGFRRLVAALRARGMGIVIDIVPNHMGVAGDTNAWWRDVLRRGKASDFADVFDIDWSRPIMLPILGTSLDEALEQGAIGVAQHAGRWSITAYDEHRFPIRDEDQDGAAQLPIATLLARQHYRLAWWRAANDELNWRRFFAINELAGVRVEDPAVFARTHALYFRLHDEGLIDGVRIDHVDGLTDPAGYCRLLRERLGPEAWIIVEKILAPEEQLARDWGIDGTSGYDFMEQVTALIHDPAGAAPLGDLWRDVSGRPDELAPQELLARQQLLAWQFSGQLEGCTDAFASLAHSAAATDGLTRQMLRRAIERLLWVFPVYRTYGTGDAAPAGDASIRATVRRRVAPHIPPGEAMVVDHILEWLASTGPGDRGLAAEAVRRFQQLSAPIAAKALEDTAFYRYGRLLSRNDVGFDAVRMSLPVAEFHAIMADRAAHWLKAMLTTATHDHKRGEDSRARLAALSAKPEQWRAAVEQWERIAAPFPDGVDRGDRYMLFQALLGAWPAGEPDASFADRIAAWQTKALREAKLRSSWEAPDTEYEDRCNNLCATLIATPAFVAAVEAFLKEIDSIARRNMLVTTALRCVVPGVPDLYQGTELGDFSLVDPDNRAPVDYQRCAAAIAAPPEKMRLILALLDLRRAYQPLFAHGTYEPATINDDSRIVAFERHHDGTTLRFAAKLGDHSPSTRIAFPSTREEKAATLFTDGPVWFEVVSA